MIFEGRFNRARELQKRNKAEREGARYEEREDDLSAGMEKGDMFAMILSALITILPVALIVLIVLAAAGYFFIVR